MDKFEHYKIRAFTHWDLYLMENQYYLGRMYIWSKRKGLVDLMDIYPKEEAELFRIGREARRALTELFQPDLFNWASLGNLSRQCHVHLVPRYQQLRTFNDITFRDLHWNQNWAPYDKDFRTPDEVTWAIRDAIRSHISIA